MSDVTISAASQSIVAGQVTSLVELIYSSGPVAFDYVFGNGQEFLHYSVSKGRSQFGFQNHYVALIDDAIVGSVACFDRKQLLQMEFACVLDMLAVCRWRFPLAVKRGLAFERIVPKPPANTLYLAHLGVAKHLRGQGIGQQLIEFVQQQAISQNYQSVVLDVAHSNPQAEHLYLRLGFERVHSRPSTIAPVVGHNRMQKRLACQSLIS